MATMRGNMSGILSGGRAPAAAASVRVVRGAAGVLAAGVLVLAAYTLTTAGDRGVNAFLLFASLWTALVYGGAAVLERRAPQWHLRAVFAAAAAADLVFWLAGLAWAATELARTTAGSCFGYGYYYSYNDDDDDDDDYGYGYGYGCRGGYLRACFIVMAVLAAVLLVLVAADLVLFVRACRLDSPTPPQAYEPAMQMPRPLAPLPPQPHFYQQPPQPPLLPLPLQPLQPQSRPEQSRPQQTHSQQTHPQQSHPEQTSQKSHLQSHPQQAHPQQAHPQHVSIHGQTPTEADNVSLHEMYQPPAEMADSSIQRPLFARPFRPYEAFRQPYEPVQQRPC